MNTQDINNNFQLDERLTASCFTLIDWPLSRVLLKNNVNYPWVILVPRHAHITEITELSRADRQQLIEEIHHASIVLQDLFKPNKMNIGALGNIVTQLHIHIVARFKNDCLWPQGIWQAAAEEKVYNEESQLICTQLTERMAMIAFD